MEAPGPARLYASAVSAALVALGLSGFFYSSSFGSPGEVADQFGLIAVNGWSNLLHALVGALGLLLAPVAARRFSLAAGLLFTVLGAWGLTIGAGEAILGFLPSNGGADLVHLLIGLTGLAAWAATPHPEGRGRRRLRRPRRPGRIRRSQAAGAPKRRSRLSGSARPGTAGHS